MLSLLFLFEKKKNLQVFWRNSVTAMGQQTAVRDYSIFEGCSLTHLCLGMDVRYPLSPSGHFCACLLSSVWYAYVPASHGCLQSFTEMQISACFHDLVPLNGCRAELLQDGMNVRWSARSPIFQGL